MIEKFLPLITSGATLVGICYFMHRYEEHFGPMSIERVYETKVVPLISEACCPHDRRKLIEANKKGLKIIRNSPIYAVPVSERRKKKEIIDYLTNTIRELESFEM